MRCLQLSDGNEVVVGQKTAFPRLIFHISYKCAAKAGKRRFSTRKSYAWRWLRKIGGGMEIGCIAAINTPEPHSRHWPKDPKKSVGQCWRANACLRAMRRQISPQRRRERREGKSYLFLSCLPLAAAKFCGEQPLKASRTGTKRKLSNPSSNVRTAAPVAMLFPLGLP